MRNVSKLVFALCTTMFATAACGGSSKPAPAATPAAAAPDAGATAIGPGEPTAAAEPGKGDSSKAEARPFAKTAAEVTSMIDDAVEKRRDKVNECVQDARKRRGDARAKIDFDLGIDQEGTLIGVKAPRGVKDDPVLNECVRKALVGAPFPRSNAGVVTVRKTFVDQVVYPK